MQIVFINKFITTAYLKSYRGIWKMCFYFFNALMTHFNYLMHGIRSFGRCIMYQFCGAAEAGKTRITC